MPATATRNRAIMLFSSSCSRVCRGMDASVALGQTAQGVSYSGAGSSCTETRALSPEGELFRCGSAPTVRGSPGVCLAPVIEGIPPLSRVETKCAARWRWHSTRASAALRFFDAFRTMLAEPLLVMMQPSDSCGDEVGSTLTEI